MPPFIPNQTLAPESAPFRGGCFSRFRRRRGFTLVEVCLAMGIMVFAATSMLGLLSTGLNRLGGSIDANQGQNILQQVVLEARQMPFATLAQQPNYTYTRQFTYEGDLVTAAPGTLMTTSTTSSPIGYTAVVNVQVPTQIPGGSVTSSNLATLTVSIRRTPGGVDVSANPPIARYVSMLCSQDLSATQ